MQNHTRLILLLLWIQPLACSDLNDSEKNQVLPRATGGNTAETDTGSNADSETHVHTVADLSVRHMNPGRPVYASAGNPLKCNDGAYGVDYIGVGTQKNNTWTAPSPAWCAIDLGDSAATEVLAVLSDEQGTANIEGFPHFSNYVIQTSANSTNGADGAWTEKISVKKNTYGYRMHRVAFLGQRWIKVIVRSPGKAVLDELDVWDVSLESGDIPDSLIWVGDSITARCADRHGTFGANPSLQQFIHSASAARYPLQIGAGTVSISTADLLSGHPAKIDRLLELYPDIHVWGILLGTNDSAGEIPDEPFKANLIRLVDKIEAAGHVPVLARIPYTNSPRYAQAIERLNTVIDTVTTQKKLTPGPDLFTLFKQNADLYYGRDTVHPNSTGCTAWQHAWAHILTPTPNGHSQRVATSMIKSPHEPPIFQYDAYFTTEAQGWTKNDDGIEYLVGNTRHVVSVPDWTPGSVGGL